MELYIKHTGKAFDRMIHEEQARFIGTIVNESIPTLHGCDAVLLPTGEQDENGKPVVELRELKNMPWDAINEQLSKLKTKE